MNKLADLLSGEEDEGGYGYAQALVNLESGTSGHPVSTLLLGDPALPKSCAICRIYILRFLHLYSAFLSSSSSSSFSANQMMEVDMHLQQLV